MVCGASIVNGDVAAVGLRLSRVDLLIEGYGPVVEGYGPVVEWLTSGKFSEVWCGGA